MNALALAVAVAIFVAVPLGHFVVSYRDLTNDLDFKARLGAGRVSKYIFRNSSLWEFHTVRLEEVIELLPVDVDRYRQAVFSASDRVVLAENRVLDAPIMSATVPISVNGAVVGRMTVETSLRPLLVETGYAALVAFVLAGLLYGAFHRWPLRAITRTLEELAGEQQRTSAALAELETSDAILRQRTAQLVETQAIGKVGDWSLTLGSGEFHLSPVAMAFLKLQAERFHPTLDAFLALLDHDSAVRFEEMIREAVESGVIQSADLNSRRGDGARADLAVTCQVSSIPDHGATRLSGTIQDITERKDAQRRLETLAYFDPLTGLANRTLFKRELNDELVRTRRIGASSALLLMDLDRFKEVNDALGHASGDELLTRVAHILSRTVRDDCFIARLGGDEFAVIVKDVGDRDAIGMVAQQIVDILAKPISLGRGEVFIGASIGIVMVPGDGADSEEITKNADLALYRSKDSGRGRYVFFESAMNELIQQKVALARDLRAASVHNRDLEVWLQPQVDIARNSVIGFESLMRWKHPDRGYVPPAEFIPIAESSSLICDIGLWILRESACIVKSWIDAGGPAYEIAVNLSPAQIWQTNIEAEVAAVLAETGLPPHLLCLELTESLLVDYTESRVRTALTGLKSLGIKLALDDFGTGYSSLGYLTKLPFDKLKIDRLFIASALSSERSRHILNGMVALGHGLGMAVVAEGIERLDELALLHEYGCDQGQGFFFGRPEHAAAALVTAARLPDLLRSTAPALRSMEFRSARVSDAVA